jgi:hypothetical protein
MELPMTARSSHSKPADAERTRVWWDHVRPDCEAFFNLSADFNPVLPAADLTDLVAQMHRLTEKIRSVPCPAAIDQPRRELLQAMSSMLISLRASLRDQSNIARENLNEALVHLQMFNLALDKLDLRYSGPTTH